MRQHAFHTMSAAGFLDWDLEQPDCRHELVDGVPVAMTGARQRHDEVVINTMLLIGPQLRAGPCRLFTADVAVRVPNGNVRRPDVGVHCGSFDDAATYAAAPRLVVEVLSPSTRAFDLARKLEEYKSIDSLDHILLVDPDAPEIILWARTAEQPWTHEIREGLDATIAMPALNISLRLADLYDGLTFRAAPRLILDGA